MIRASRPLALFLLTALLSGCSLWKKDSEDYDPFAEAPGTGFVEKKAAPETASARPYKSAGIESDASGAGGFIDSQGAGAITEPRTNPDWSRTSTTDDLDTLLPPGSPNKGNQPTFPNEPLSVGSSGETSGDAILGGPVATDAPIETDAPIPDLGKMKFDDSPAGDPLDPASSPAGGITRPPRDAAPVSDFDRTYGTGGGSSQPLSQSPGGLALNTRLPTPEFKNPALNPGGLSSDMGRSAAGAVAGNTPPPYVQTSSKAAGLVGAVENPSSSGGFASASYGSPADSFGPVRSIDEAPAVIPDPVSPPQPNEPTWDDSAAQPMAAAPESTRVITDDPLLVAVESGRSTPSTDVAPAPALTSPAPKSPAAAPAPPDPKELERTAIQHYQSRQFDQAISSFQKYLSLGYPDANQEIQWRLAQSLYESNRLNEAAEEFRKLVGSPNPENRADALLKLGLIDERNGEIEVARTRWTRVVETYPNTKAASTAQAKLASNAP